MDALLEVILQIIFQLVIEVVFAICEHLFGRKVFKETPNIAVKRIFYIVCAALLGWGSLYIFPHGFIHNPLLQAANLIISPIIAGLVMGFIGNWRQRRNKNIVDMETFSYAFLLAFVISLVRLIWTVK